MSGYIKYVDNGWKNMSFLIEDDSILVKYNDIWNKIKNRLNMKFHSKPDYNEKYLKTKVKAYNGVVNTIFQINRIPKERILNTCMAVTCIGPFMKMNKKNQNYPQVNLKECRYEIKKKMLAKFIDVELD